MKPELAKALTEDLGHEAHALLSNHRTVGRALNHNLAEVAVGPLIGALGGAGYGALSPDPKPSWRRFLGERTENRSRLHRILVDALKGAAFGAMGEALHPATRLGGYLGAQRALQHAKSLDEVSAAINAGTIAGGLVGGAAGGTLMGATGIKMSQLKLAAVLRRHWR